MSRRKAAVLVVAGLAAVTAALPLAGISRLGLLATIYHHGGKWFLAMAAIAVGVMLGHQLDRMIESRKERAHSSETRR